MSDNDNKIELLEAEIRALKALILQLPSVTEKRIAAAKKEVRAKAKGRLGALQEELSRGGPIDKKAEPILDELAFQIKNRDKE